jgi:SAM-dependent methyltransferase
VTYGERDAAWDRQRLSFGDCAATYDAARPEWPAATARWLTGTEDGGPLAALGRPPRVADVGAGTGKLTRTLVAAGHEVVAVDPSEGMLAMLRAALPGTPTFIGTGEQLPLPDASVDAVTVAQAWHWFDAEAAAAEIARVLRPGGVLGIAWHIRDETVPWVHELTELTHPMLSSSDSKSTLLESPAFEPRERTVFRYEQRLTVEELVTLASSWSYVATRPDRERVLRQVRELGERVAAGRGALVVPHDTRCFRFRRAVT